MDGGVVANTAYEGYLNYKIYDELVTATPPLFILGAKMAYQIFGVYWSSLPLLLAFFAVIIFIWHVLILRALKVDKLWSLLIPYTLISINLVTTSFWWYNRITIVCLTLFVTSAILFMNKPNTSLSRITLIISSILISLSKPNSAGLALVVMYLILFLAKSKKLVIQILLLSITGTLIILIISGIDPFKLINNYTVLATSGRVTSVANWKSFLIDINFWEVRQTTVFLVPAIIAFVLMLVHGCVKRIIFKKDIPLLFFIPAVLFISLAGMVTNNDYKMVGLGPVFMVTILMFQVWRNRVKNIHFPFTVNILLLTSSLLLIFSSINIGFSRISMRENDNPYFLLRGWNVFYDDYPTRPLVKLDHPPYWKGFTASQSLYNTVKQIDEIVTSAQIAGSTDPSVYFGPRIDFSYAAYGIHPPKGIPIWWEGYSDETKIQNAEIIERFMNYRFKIAIFYQDDFTFMPRNAVEYLKNEYDVYNYGSITIRLLKNDTSFNLLKNKLRST